MTQNTDERYEENIVKQQHEFVATLDAVHYFDSFPLPLLALNDKRQIVLVNKAFSKALSIGAFEDILGKRPGEAMRCVYSNHEETGCGTAAPCRGCGALRAILESMEKSCKTDYCCELLTQGEDGPIAMDLRIFVSPWQVEGNAFSVVTIMDIADQRRREAMERTFFHDILNSAGGAKGLVDSLLMDSMGEEKQMMTALQSSLFSLVEEIKRQKDLVSIENNEYSSSPMTLQGREFLESIAHEYRAHPLAYKKEIQVDRGGGEVTLRTDYTLLRRVLINMVINGLEAIHQNETVTLGLRDEGDKVMFWAQNPGHIAEDVRLQIYKRSFSTKGQGRGLGTYSIKLFTEKYLKGQTGFSSSEADGTTFWIRLDKQLAD